VHGAWGALTFLPFCWGGVVGVLVSPWGLWGPWGGGSVWVERWQNSSVIGWWSVVRHTVGS
jgi:hypothetical protein